MVEARQFRYGDFGSLDRRAEDYRAQIDAAVAHSPYVRTILLDGEPVAVMGMSLRWPGVAMAWAVVTDKIRGRGLAFTRITRRLIEQFERELNLWKVNAEVLGENEEYARWLEALGFSLEGVDFHGGPRTEHIYRYGRSWASSRQTRHRPQ